MMPGAQACPAIAGKPECSLLETVRDVFASAVARMFPTRAAATLDLVLEVRRAEIVGGIPAASSSATPMFECWRRAER